jgi:putative zinc-binding metallo-peptidase
MPLAHDGVVHDTSDDWEGQRRTLLSQRISELGLSIRGTLVEQLVVRHEAGHAFNYAYRLYERADWHSLFGPYSRPYRERYRADPFSRQYVRHILGWYAQKHPDEDFAETFAVWLTPGLDWRAQYAGWPALAKLEYVDTVMREVGSTIPIVPAPTDDDLPVEAMHYTVEEHYRSSEERLPIEDERHFDGDLRTIFASPADAPQGERAADFLRRHRREVVRRIAYWTGESATTLRAFVDFLAARADVLDLRVAGLEAATLIELTSFGTAMIMNYRYTNVLGRRKGSPQ